LFSKIIRLGWMKYTAQLSTIYGIFAGEVWCKEVYRPMGQALGIKSWDYSGVSLDFLTYAGSSGNIHIMYKGPSNAVVEAG